MAVCLAYLAHVLNVLNSGAIVHAVPKDRTLRHTGVREHALCVHQAVVVCAHSDSRTTMRQSRLTIVMGSIDDGCRTTTIGVHFLGNCRWRKILE
ncbi:MAG: hypothetical protein J3R72DRAFT_436539 [Linnemannia gamsii]|nr:MAG: hypothetical protein J3R72DRAFT_436539 [Linnemannia gamsii]